jgi:hypothetical protein
MAPRSFEIVAYQNRTIDFSAELFEADGVTGVVLQDADTVRFKLSYGTGAPLLELSTDGPNTNDSSVTVNDLGGNPEGAPAKVTIRMAQVDLKTVVWPGTFDAEISVVDATETSPFDAIKSVQLGIVHVLRTPGGTITL